MKNKWAYFYLFGDLTTTGVSLYLMYIFKNFDSAPLIWVAKIYAIVGLLLSLMSIKALEIPENPELIEGDK